MSKEFKLILDDNLWERFYRAFPGHGERSTLIRSFIRHIIVLKCEEKSLHARAAEAVFEDWKKRNPEEEA